MIHHAKVQVLPVIEPGAAEVTVIQVETKRPDQPEPGTRRHAGTANCPRVGRDLGLEQHHVQPGQELSQLKALLSPDRRGFIQNVRRIGHKKDSSIVYLQWPPASHSYHVGTVTRAIQVSSAALRRR